MMASDIPTSLTRFIGRQGELRDLRQLLGNSRLVTITGAGGTGKTRLAAEIARHQAVSEAQKVYWVELAPLTDGGLLMEHLAACLPSQERPDRSLHDTLVDSLRGAPCLLVLDNCEHLVDACATLVSQLLRSCPELRVLATSREALGIDGEHAWLLRGLSLGTAASVEGSSTPNEAAEFFIDRARAVSAVFQVAPNLEAIERICRRLDGIPLAIELAAARLGALTASDIANRLDDLFRLLPSGSRTANSRQRTLKATVEWSYRLISEEERLLLRRISVFFGSFSLEAVESVCADQDLPAERVLDLLAGLVTRSLVSMHEDADTARYSVPEFIRQYAAELLAAEPDRAARQRLRHAEYFATLAEAARHELERTHSPAWIRTLTLEYDNLRAALAWSFAAPRQPTAHRLVGALSWYWPQTWQLSELHLWLDQALKNPPAELTPEWGLVLNCAGSTAFMHGQHDRARQLLESAVAVFEHCADPLHEVVVRSTLANLLASLDELDSALRHGERAAALARDLPESWPLGHAMSNGLAQVYVRLGRLDEADACLVEADTALRRRGRHEWGLLEVARARASLAIDRRQYDLARRQVLEAIHAALAILRPHSMYRVLVIAQRLYCAMGAFAAAARLQPVLASADESGLMPFPDDARHQAESTAILARTLGGAALQRPNGAPLSQGFAETLQRVQQELSAESPAPSDQATNESPRARPDLHISLLGTVEVIAGGEPVHADTWRQSKLLELLAFLLFHPDGRTRDQIGAALWPDFSSAQVKNNFHVLLHKLRRHLGRTDAVIAVADRYRFNPALRLWFDASRFAADMTAALREPGPGARDRLASALHLYRGDLLAGAEVGDWATEHRDELRGMYLDGLGALAERHLAAGDAARAIAALQEIFRLDAQREEGSRRLMQVLADNGQLDAALAHYRRLTARLLEELAVAPAPATAALARSLAAPRNSGEIS